MSDGPVAWTTGQLARRVCLSQRTIERYCDDGVIACERTRGGHRRIPASAVEAFLRGESAA